MLDLTITLDDKYRKDRGQAYMSGIQALVRLPMLQRQMDRAAGLDTAGFISGYRGSPLGGYDFELWRARKLLEEQNITFQPGLNEDLAATSVWGSQQVGFFPGAKYDGVFAIWYGKAPGVDRSGDVLKHGNFAGTARHGGVLVLAGDDHAAKSTSTASQSEYAFLDAMIPVLAPSGIQEFMDLGLFGFALSRFSGLWVGFKLVATNIDTSGTVEIVSDRAPFVIPEDFELPPDGLHARWPDDRIPQEPRLKHFKLPAAQAFARANGVDRLILDAPKPRLGIVTAGKSYLDVRRALADLGIDAARAKAHGIRLYKLALTWPIEPQGFLRFAKGLEEILVVEEKRDFIEAQLKAILYDHPSSGRPRVVGKTDETGKPLLPSILDLDSNTVAAVIGRRLLGHKGDADLEKRIEAIRARRPAGVQAPVMARTPFFCSGCPHNTSTVVPEGSEVLAGIGCHSLAMFTGRATTFTQMGGEGVSWIGMAPFTEMPHIFQNLGDGTYYHSGLLGVRAAVAAETSITFKILFNDAVAMTGGQPIDGPLTVPQITRQLHAEGVGRIEVVTDEPHKYPRGAGFASGVTVHHRDDLDHVQRMLREVPGVTALIYDQTCAAEKRRRRKRGTFADPPRRVFINELVCEGCGDCSAKSNCLSVVPVETEFGRKRAIDQSSCNKDYSCLRGFCPSLVTVEGGVLREAAGGGSIADLPDLPEPKQPALKEPWPMLVAGIGGTGVVTVGAILGVAAHIEGKASNVADITGLSQKGGPVLSQITIAKRREQLSTPQIPAGGTRALVGCDIVVASMPEAVSKLAPGITRAVVNLQQTPTGEFTQNPDKAFLGDEMRRLIEGRIDDRNSDFIEASRAALGLIGDTIAVNMFMVGFAWQKGLVPIGRAAIEQAIRLNGTRVDENVRAFAWGRCAAHDPDYVARALEDAAGAAPPAPKVAALDDIVAVRADFLTGYQNAAYASRYEQLVKAVREAETARAPGMSGLAEAVARYAFKLMAYKDEYEVARLFTDDAFRTSVARRFDGNYKLRFHLAPPVFARKDKATGLPRKSAYGPWMMLAFRLLVRVKVLRGTAFDPFGWTAERRRERILIDSYRSVVDELCASLTHDNHALAVEIASVPEHIRGYGHVKAAHLEEAKTREAELLAAFRAPPTELSAAE